jgi:hypothetical protein
MGKAGMSVTEVAERVGRNNDTVLRWIKLGWRPRAGEAFIRLGATRNGGRWTISDADLKTFQDDCHAASVIEVMPEPKRKQRRGKERSRAERHAAAKKQLEAMGY